MDIHHKCGLPIDLCICGGENDPHAVYKLQCGLCGKEWVGVVPAGVPVDKFQCPECLKQGFCINIGE